MGASKQQRRKQQRLIQAKKAQKDLFNTVSLPASDTAYKIIGGIAPEAFDMSDTHDVPKRNSLPYKIVSSIASEIPALLEPSKEVASMPAEDRCADFVVQHRVDQSSTPDSSEIRIDFVQEVDCKKHTARFQWMEGFNSAFTFDSTLPEQGKTEAFHRQHAPTPTSVRRIGAIFKSDEPSETTTTFVARNTKNVANTPSIFQRLQISNTAVATHRLQEAHDSKTQKKQQQLVPFSNQDASSDAMRLLALGKPMNMISAATNAWVYDQFLRVFDAKAQKVLSVPLADDVCTAVISDMNTQQNNGAQQSKDLTKLTITTTEHTSVQYNDKHWALVLYYTLSFPHLSEDSASHPFDEDKDEGNTESSSSNWSVSRVFMVTTDGFTYLVDHQQMLYNHVQIINEDASDFDSVASPWKAIPHIDFDTNMASVVDFDEHESALSKECEDSILQPHFGELTEEREEIYEYDGDRSHDHEASQETTVIGQESYLETSTEGSRRDEDDLVDFDDALTTSPNTTSIKDSTKLNKESIVAAEWARALTHTMLGTESLFTYMNVLSAKPNGNATKTALVTAFLQLVDFERQKLEETLLPRSCTASSILSSKVLPHTIMLGTTSLAAFLSEIEIEFDTNDETTLVGVFEAFKKLGKKEVQVRNMAAQGIMGALLRALT